MYTSRPLEPLDPCIFYVMHFKQQIWNEKTVAIQRHTNPYEKKKKQRKKQRQAIQTMEKIIGNRFRCLAFDGWQP